MELDHVNSPSATYSWDGWPNGSFVSFLVPHQVRNTNMINIHWSSEIIANSRKGSPGSDTWKRGKATKRRCLGAIKCFNEVCDVCSPPAVRGIHIAQQLDARCLCGAVLEHRSCSVHWTIHVYAGGARLENFGQHSHPRFTHRLSVRRKERPHFSAFETAAASSLDEEELRLLDSDKTGPHVRFEVNPMTIEDHSQDESYASSDTSDISSGHSSAANVADELSLSEATEKITEVESVTDLTERIPAETKFLVSRKTHSPLFLPSASVESNRDTDLSDEAEQDEIEADPYANEDEDTGTFYKNF
ncbi:hypothetical protein MSAN_01992100 [Mycena sanguinolenta]|uniref:Uncharacterized protein n=1 Tax=Mycena sanguinolenta TaxID=230812 RepID=A0A8H6XLU2_9AGAR|nr:hypothetical protein MSAN_01992100 [Mycena sanguinolenta]